jgi:hypothetical protein
MIETRVFSVDPDSGMTRNFHFDTETDEITFETRQDVGALLEATQARQRDTDERAGWKGDMHWVGSIPLNVFYELKRKYPDPEEMTKHAMLWLEEHNKFKTRTRI